MARHIKGTEPHPFPAERAARAKPPDGGPHKPAQRKKESAESNDPAYVVTVTKREKADDVGEKENKYRPSPETLREKAKTLLNSEKLTQREREVLKSILDPEE